jgi:hypothetical protein
MPAPLEPARAGSVASLLKSLRTRAGLQEKRLTGTELQLDVLAELPIVRALHGGGEPLERAIVQAVRTAASSLEPTPSIVSDVCLCLRLSADAVADRQLYADDLGERREALLRNWDALHELRSVSPAPEAPTLRALRFQVESVALGALATALTSPADGGSATWVLQSGAGRVPEGEHSATPIGAAPGMAGRQPVLLYQVFQQVASALRSRLVRDADGRPTGWPQDLRSYQSLATPQATAYGLTALLILEGHLAVDLEPVIVHLRNMAQRGGGYATRDQAAARPEATARVLEALHYVDGTADLRAELGAMEQTVGDFERHRPYILSTVLECLAQIAPDSSFAQATADELLAARATYGQHALWPEKVIDQESQATASVTHTARAVRALAQFQEVRPSADAAAAIADARDWLVTQSANENVSEILERPLGDGKIERATVRHFTAAWVVKALISAGLPASHPAVSAAVAQVWRQYSEAVSLWTYRNGDVPIWMTTDAVDSLRLTALASIRAGRTDKVQVQLLDD